MSTELKNSLIEDIRLKDIIYTIRGKQVILDADLAMLYGYTVKRLNEQVKRNIERFPTDFMFQLTLEEARYFPRSQFATLEGKGKNVKYAPYVFTEQGVYMLSAVLKGELAIYQSIEIIRMFKEMRHYLIQNQQVFNSQSILDINDKVMQQGKEIIEIKTIINSAIIKKEDIKKIMDQFIDEEVIKQIVILDRQQFEANEAYISIYKQAKSSIYIIDDYININILSLLKYKREGIEVIIFSDNKGTKQNVLHEFEFINFNLEYPTLVIKQNNGKCHDRFIILDYQKETEKIYHCGASSKDAGKKVCCINLIMEKQIVHTLIETLLNNNKYTFW